MEELDFYKDNGVFLPMINDTGRNIFYKSLIENNVKDKVVVDIGAGTGFLSVLAHKAGAKKVYAVEADIDRWRFLRWHVIEPLGLIDHIIPIHANFLDSNIAGDFYVSETFGYSIFNENIINIADHARSMGGTFLPGKVKVWVEVFNSHPIFTLLQKHSDAFDFQPDITIDPVFEKLISSKVYNETAKYRANCLPNFFKFYQNSSLKDELKITSLYKSEPIEIDFNAPRINASDISLTIPYSSISDNNEVTAAIFWSTEYGNDIMDVRDTWWSTPIKTFRPTKDVVVQYHEVENFNFAKNEQDSYWSFYY